MLLPLFGFLLLRSPLVTWNRRASLRPLLARRRANRVRTFGATTFGMHCTKREDEGTQHEAKENRNSWQSHARVPLMASARIAGLLPIAPILTGID